MPEIVKGLVDFLFPPYSAKSIKNEKKIALKHRIGDLWFACIGLKGHKFWL